jgi:hypothetical protein
VERVAVLTEVRTVRAPSGTVRYIARDADGHEYTTFREDIGERARQLQNQRVRIGYHQERRGQYDNTYLDRIEPAEPEGGTAPGAGTDPQESAWRTAVDAAPWLVGEPGEAVPAEELYEKLKPFEERVAGDIEREQGDSRD